MSSKRCSRCGRELPLSQYHVNCRTRDKHTTICKECTSRISRERYKQNSEAARKRAREYVLSDPQRNYENKCREYSRNPSHKNAGKVVAAAVLAGILEKPNVCYGCGCPDTERRMEAHHHDYSNQLSVVWLCPVCHAALDMKRRAYLGKDENAGASANSIPVIGTNDEGYEIRFPSQNAAYIAGFKNIRECIKHPHKECGGFHWRVANAKS